MGSLGKYAGQPNTFACAKCRRLPEFLDIVTGHTSDTIGRRFTTTGKTRHQLSEGANHHGWPSTAYQYRCSGCGHVGWSRHPGVRRVFHREHPGEDPEEEKTG